MKLFAAPIILSLTINLIVNLAFAQHAGVGTNYTIVPPGNTLPQIPPIPEKSLNRHLAELFSSDIKNNPLPFYIKRYESVREKLFTKYKSKDFDLKEEIHRAAQLYGIDPIHIVSAIIGEHVFNVDLKDDMQIYTLRLKMWQSHFGGTHPFAEVSKCPEMILCEKQPTEFLKWDCYGYQWQNLFKGKLACGKTTAYDDKFFVTAFFDPTLAGKSYGLGQLGPVKILSVTDIVAAKSGFPKLSIDSINEVYQAALDPKLTVHYIAAAIYSSIEIYKKEAQFDISQNPGLTSTLYNLGQERARAMALAKQNAKNIKEQKPVKAPEVNYYGWFVNYVQNDLKKFISY